jgi:Ca2+-binding RTX toxin-like protein
MMKTQHKFICRLKDQRGVSAIIIAIVLAVLIGFAALAVDIGYLYATRNELQNVADAAALAATGQLGAIYASLTQAEQLAYVYDPNDATDQLIVQYALDVGLENKAAGKDVIILPDEVDVGIWEVTTRVFTLEYTRPNAVRVITRRDDTVATGKVSLFFARILGIDEAGVTAMATAALTPPSSVVEGELKLPIGISERMFDQPIDPEACDDPLQFSPTDTCVGWHNFLDAINASAMKLKLLGFIEGHPELYPDEECEPGWEPCGGQWLKDNFDWDDDDLAALVAAVTPDVSDENSFQFQGGDIAALFTGDIIIWDGETPMGHTGTGKNPAPIIALFDYFRFRDGDGDNSVWTTTIPIYADGDVCENPNTLLDIVGFDKIEVTEVLPPSGTSLTVERTCEMTQIEGRGGGGVGIIVGSLPNLVQ